MLQPAKQVSLTDDWQNSRQSVLSHRAIADSAQTEGHCAKLTHMLTACTSASVLGQALRTIRSNELSIIQKAGQLPCLGARVKCPRLRAID